MRQHHDWAGIIRRLRKRPGKWERTLHDVPARTAQSIRLRRHPDLRVADGRLEPLIVQSYVDDNGHARCDIWLSFTPNRE